MDKSPIKRMRVFVCLPCFNEAESLTELLPKLPYNVVAVDDGSTDNTPQILHKHRARVITHFPNLGLAEVYRTIIEYVKTEIEDDDIIIIMDADLTHDPSYIKALLNEIEKGADIAIASRYGGGMEVGVPLKRKLLSRGVNWLIRNLTHLPVKDCTSGFRCFKTKILKDLPPLRADGFEVSAELLIKASRLNPKPNIVEVPFALRYNRKKGESKLRLGKTVKAYLKLLWRETQIDLTPRLSWLAHKVKLGKVYDRDPPFWNDGMLALAFLIVSFFVYDNLTYTLPQILRLGGYVGIAFVSFCIQHVLRRFWVFRKA